MPRATTPSAGSCGSASTTRYPTVVRVAVVIERFGPDAGGAEQVAYHQVVELARRGIDVSVLCRASDVAAPRGARIQLVPTPRFWQPLRVLWFSLRAARAIQGFDVAHGFSRTRHQDIYRAGAGSHAAYMEQMYPNAERLRRFSPRHRTLLAIEEAVFRDSRQLIQCNARMNADAISTRYGVERERLAVIYNGVDIQRFHPEQRGTLGRELRKQLGIEEPIALFAGSGFERKGLDRAILGLANSGARATLLVAGNGARESYRELIQHCGLRERIRFLGKRSDMPALYAAADLFVLPTRYDPFANACLEAMAAGVAVATTHSNGACELIEPGFNGWIGVDDFAPAFALLSDEARLREMGRAARQAAEQLTWSAYTERVLELYRKVAR